MHNFKEEVLSFAHHFFSRWPNIACRYQFLEIFAGAAVVTEAISKLGVVCGPPIELLDPPEFDMKSHHLMRCITRISSVLRRIGSLMVAGGLYLCTPYVPTRLNVADDPTRDQKLRVSAGRFGEWSRERFMDLALCKPLKRWCSNWLRLVLVALGFSPVPSARGLPHRRLALQWILIRRWAFPVKALGFSAFPSRLEGSSLSSFLDFPYCLLPLAGLLLSVFPVVPLSSSVSSSSLFRARAF